MSTKQFYEETAKEYDQRRNKNYLRKAIENFNLILDKYNVNNKNILEVGIGTGELFRLLCSKSRKVYGFDVAENMVNITNNKTKNKNLYVADAQNIPNKEKNFDFVFCMDVLEHLENPEKCLSEINRVLKNNGTAFIINPNPLWAPIQFLAELFRLKVKEGKHNFVVLEKIISDRFKIIHKGHLVFFPFNIPSKVDKFFEKMPLTRNLGFSQLFILKKIN